MSQDYGIVDGPTVIRSPLMEITAAYADVFDFEKDVFFADLRDWNFPVFYGMFLIGLVDYRRYFGAGHGL